MSLHIYFLYGAFLIKTVWDDLEQNLLHFTTFMRIANICQGYFCQFVDHNYILWSLIFSDLKKMEHSDILQTDNYPGKEEFKNYFLGQHGQ